MDRRTRVFRCLLLLFVTVAATMTACADPGRKASARVDFVRDIRPILSNNCFQCHGPDAKARKADLRLDTKNGLFADLNGSRVIVPGKPERSELLRRISARDPDVRMPPKSAKRRLTVKQIESVRRWILQGANWSGHWAFQSPRRPAFPVVRNPGWIRNGIDAFILARLEKEGWQPSRAATKETLIRRLTLDLTGLPPTIAEIDAFLRDGTPDAYEKVIDRLLSSPANGERMAWEWLDAARYSDTSGFQGDPERTMWPWRDWLVNALNDNKPFDQFTVEMLAGDLLPKATRQQIIATGFNRNHMINGEGGRIPEETRVENVFDRAETTATVWLGLTMTCCRCHDHKFDPVTQREYYRFFAFFNNTSEDGRLRSPRGALVPTIDFITADQKRQLASLQQQVAQIANRIAERERLRLPKSGRKSALSKKIQALLKRPPQQRNAKTLDTLIKHFSKTDADYAKALKNLRNVKGRQTGIRKRIARVMVMDDRKNPRQTFILTRGLYTKPTQKVAAGTPAFLFPLPKSAPRNRLTLARWLVNPAHPLTARVTVNRYWQQFFGIGIVKSSEDFGSQGERPSHPRLLDWLAGEFVRSGWDVKHLHRLIVTSAAYRQSSRFNQMKTMKQSRTLRVRSGHAKPGSIPVRDPKNRLISRGSRFRMPSWMIRDSALALSGLLVRKVGGPPVNSYQPAGIWADATFGKKRYRQDHGSALYRRSAYTFWRRIVGPTIFFNTSSRQACTVQPSRTNTPLHALITLNDVTYVEAARQFAARVMKKEASARARIVLAFRMATSRRPTDAEFRILSSRLKLLTKQFHAKPQAASLLLKIGESPRDRSLPAADHAAYTALCTLILNLDEVLTRE